MSEASDKRVKDFAASNRIRLCNTRLSKKFHLSHAEETIPGKFGELAAFDNEHDFRLRLLAVPRTKTMNGALLNRRREALAAGLRLKCKSGAESIFYFDPDDARQTEVAIRLVGAGHRSAPLSPEARLKRLERLGTHVKTRAVKPKAQKEGTTATQ